VDLIWQAIGDAIRLIVRADAELMRIAGLSLVVSGAATSIAALLGIPLGIALYVGRFPGRALGTVLVNAGMALPPVVVGLLVMLVLWRTGPLGPLRLLFTPPAMVIAQVIVALPLIAGFSRAAISLLDPDLVLAMRADGAGETRIGVELARATRAPLLVAVAAGFGRAISEVGASLMVGGNIVGQTRILTTSIALESGRGEFALALALGFILLLLALGVNVLLGLAASPSPRLIEAAR
jgi:tungstate transport system permease protein